MSQPNMPLPETPTPISAPSGDSAQRGIGWFRWVVCGLLFFATTINYVDRNVISVLKDTLETQFHWNDIDYGNIIFFFSLAYAAGYLLAGKLMDHIGVRKGFAIAVTLWSVAAMGHGLIALVPSDAVVALPSFMTFLAHDPKAVVLTIGLSVIAFCLMRFCLGLAEGGNFPGAIKTVSEWFPKKERALATGIFNAGSNVGALITPIAVPLITRFWGWAWAFYITGAFGFLWLCCWLWIYQSPDKHPRLSARERAYIQSDPPDPPVKISWLHLLGYRATWAYTIGMLLTSPIWWFYLYWVPDFLYKQHGLDLKNIGPPLVVIYLMTDVGSVAGGWFSSSLIKRGWSLNAARKTALLACACCVVPVFFASRVSNLWAAVLLIGLAASAHQGWSANLFTVVSDTMPRRTVSSVVGIGGMAAAIGAMFNAKLTGYILEVTKDPITGITHGYYIPFAIAASAYLVALLIIHLILPKIQPAHT